MNFEDMDAIDLQILLETIVTQLEAVEWKIQSMVEAKEPLNMWLVQRQRTLQRFLQQITKYMVGAGLIEVDDNAG